MVRCRRRAVRAHHPLPEDVGHRVHRHQRAFRARRLRLARDRRRHAARPPAERGGIVDSEPGNNPLAGLLDRLTSPPCGTRPSCCRSSTAPGAAGTTPGTTCTATRRSRSPATTSPASTSGTSPCGGNDRCINGKFIQYVEPSDAFFYDSTAPVHGRVDPPTGPIGAPNHATSTARRPRGARPALRRHRRAAGLRQRCGRPRPGRGADHRGAGRRRR